MADFIEYDSAFKTRIVGTVDYTMHELLIFV